MDIFEVTSIAKKSDRDMTEWLQERGLLKRQVCMGCFILPYLYTLEICLITIINNYNSLLIILFEIIYNPF